MYVRLFVQLSLLMIDSHTLLSKLVQWYLCSNIVLMYM